MELRSFRRDCSCSYLPQQPARLDIRRQRPWRSPPGQQNCRVFQRDFAGCRHHRDFQSTRRRAADLTADGSGLPEQEPPIEIFPRIKESNPYRRLGVSEEATFEEIQEARNFLYEAYKQHEPSREAIELAFEKLLKTSFKNRGKYGFQPPRTGKRSDRKADVLPPTLMERIKDAVEPDLSVAAFVNDGSIFLVLGVWAAWQVKVTDPTLPMALTVIYAGYKFFQKRKNRNPDGPWFGGSPLWGALGMTLLGSVIGALVSVTLVRLVPLPAQITPDSFALFAICILLGLFTLFFR